MNVGNDIPIASTILPEVLARKYILHRIVRYMTNKTAPAVLIALLFVGASIIALQHNDEAQTTQDEMESNDLPPIPLVKRTTQGIQA